MEPFDWYKPETIISWMETRTFAEHGSYINANHYRKRLVQHRKEGWTDETIGLHFFSEVNFEPIERDREKFFISQMAEKEKHFVIQ